MAHDMLLHSSGSEPEVNASQKVQMLLKDTFQNSGTNSSQPIGANLLSPQQHQNQLQAHQATQSPQFDAINVDYPLPPKQNYQIG